MKGLWILFFSMRLGRFPLKLTLYSGQVQKLCAVLSSPKKLA